MIKVAITDDHPLIVNGISELISKLNGIDLVASFEDLHYTRKGLEIQKIDVLLLDINLPDGNGIDFCKEISQLYPELKIIALTTYNQTMMVKNMIRNGAKGYLLKNTSMDIIEEAIQKVSLGEQYLQSDVQKILLDDSLGQSHQKLFLPRLTRREKEVLELICEEFTTNEIAEKLFISPKTAETHRLNLIQKLGVRNTAGLVKEAINLGLLEN